MASRTIPVAPFDLYIFGGTGDLTYRKLLPALLQRFACGQIIEGSRIIALSRHKLGEDLYREEVRKRLADDEPAVESSVIEAFIMLLTHQEVDALNPDSYQCLVDNLIDDSERVRVFYLAVHPDLYGAISLNLQTSGLVHDVTRVVLEKPIGLDGASAAQINDSVGAVFSEDQIYRIDHYLGKETVQNLMALRFANALFEPLWNAFHIDSINITVAEELGVGTRATYYDHSGAMRDMVQNHILQLLCLVAMEPPVSMDASSVRDEKLKVLKSLRPITGEDVRRKTVRGRYTGGSSGGQPVPGYLDEEGVAKDSTTETFVALQADIDNWRWSGVPFYIRTGKRMTKRVSEIVASYRSLRHSIFPDGSGELQQNQLIIRLQPDEGITLEAMIKEPGPGGFRLRQVPLDFSFHDDIGVSSSPNSYERLLMDVVRGNQTLFMRRDEVAAAWDWVDPILEAWQNYPYDVKGYTAGTWGPSASIALLANNGHAWREDR